MKKSTSYANIERDDLISSANWNTAQGYSVMKIQKPLIQSDELITLALFGTPNLIDDFSTPPEIINEVRVKALTRLHETLVMLIDNCYFALGNKDKELLDEYMAVLSRLKAILPTTYSRLKNHRDKTESIKIHEEKFTKVLDIMRNIMKLINIPLNENNLIFGVTEEYDPDVIKEKIKEDMIFSG